MSLYISQCGLCSHAWDRNRRGEPPKARCDAFPDGIPDAIRRNEVVHNKPYPGDHGIRYKYFEAKEKPPGANTSGRLNGRAFRACALLKQLSDPTRLQVMLMLDQGEFSVGALRQRLEQSQTAVSHHLALMRHGGMIAPRRQGNMTFYSLTDTGSELVRILKQLELRSDPMVGAATS